MIHLPQREGTKRKSCPTERLASKLSGCSPTGTGLKRSSTGSELITAKGYGIMGDHARGQSFKPELHSAWFRSTESISSQAARLPVFSAAIKVVPDPLKG
jgi:uncharacterized membrane protein